MFSKFYSISKFLESVQICMLKICKTNPSGNKKRQKLNELLELVGVSCTKFLSEMYLIEFYLILPISNCKF